MTKEEVIETLENHHLWTGEPRELIDVRKANKALNIAIDTIKKLSAIEDIITCPLPIQKDICEKKNEQTMEWIPVSEPPKELGTYLIQTDGEPYMCQCRWTDVSPFRTDYKNKPHWNIFDLPQYSKVVAWMPLPKPYKEREEV